MKTQAINEFFSRLAALRPEPKSELDYVNPYTLLVAVVLSAQMTDAGVNKATAPLFKKVTTPQAMLRLGEEGLKTYIKSINLLNNKAKNIIALSQVLVDKYDGQVPEDRDALVALPGVGRKTANVVLNVAFGQPTMAVDTHVFRVANRTGLASGKTPDEVEANLLKVIPDKWLRHAHHWLILHGRYVCKAKKPDCAACLVRDLCAFKEKTGGALTIPATPKENKT
ncbi:MAG: endonuclease III [Alphaproteobacteria bacterium]|nr:endonuclease III [Alphaproteobacteria bacterium]